MRDKEKTMKGNQLIVVLLILSLIAAGKSWADTGTVDAEVVAATKEGPTAVKNLERRAIDTIKSNASALEKDQACRILRVIGTTDSVEALAALLPDERLSHMARYVVESMKYPEADKALCDALGKTSGSVKVGIVHSLAMRADERNVDSLVPLLKDSDTEIAAAAAWALGRTASPKAVRALSDYYENAPKEMRFAAADGLLNAADRLMDRDELEKALGIYKQLQTADAPEHVRMGAFAGSIEAQPDNATDMLVEAIGSDDWKIRGMAIDMIVTLKGEGITERFSAGLEKMYAETQVLVLGALVDRGEKDALRPVITKAVSNSNTEIRRLAIKSLGNVGDGSSVKVLADIIESDADNEEKTLAASSLRRLLGKSINGEIVRAMVASSSEAKVKLIEILRDREAAEAVDELLGAASDKDADVRKAAFKSLADLARPGDQNALIELLVNLKGDEGRSEAERALISVTRKLDETAGIGPILAEMDSTTETKCSLLRVLGGVGNVRGFEVVRKALEGDNTEVRDAAVRTLADWPDPTAARILLKVYQATSNRVHRVVALRGCVRQLSMGELPSAEMLSICSELMKGADGPDEKKLVLACVAKSGDPDAIAIVEPLLDDERVRAEAEHAMLGVIRNMMAANPDEAAAAARSLRAKSKNRTVQKDAAAVIELVEKFGDYVMAWEVSGPHSKPFADTFDTAFGPEKTGAEDVLWKTLPISRIGNRPWMFDLQATLGGQRKAGYVRTWVYSDREQAARIEFGTDDGNKLWFNDKLVHADRAGGSAVPGEHKVAVKLQKGWNAILLKVTQDTGPWQFCLAVRKPDGKTLEGLGISASKPME